MYKRQELWNHWHIALPRFCPISGCIEYVEGFRPEAIRAYSILDTHFITRMTMGAIIGKGPNKAEPHSHDNPVSYTHLDVYKRQSLSRAWEARH